jgi:hypothetical protein
LIRGLAHVTAAQRDARRDVSHIFMHPPFACAWLQPHRHPAGAARRNIPGLSATDATAAINASASTREQRSEKGTAPATLALPSMNAFSSQLRKKPMDQQAK